MKLFCFVLSVLLLLQPGSGFHLTPSRDGGRPTNGGVGRIIKEEWTESSLRYYRTITRGGAAVIADNPLYLQNAMESYFARQKIKEGKAHHAETIYRRLLEEMTHNTHHRHHHKTCNLSAIAVPTLLLALHLQREDRSDDAREVFESFLYLLDEDQQRPKEESSIKLKKDHGPEATACRCCCCARVVQAHALFEMKQGNPETAVKLIQRAVRIDRSLRPVLRWKHFQEAMSATFEQQQLRGSSRGLAIGSAN